MSNVKKLINIIVSSLSFNNYYFNCSNVCMGLKFFRGRVIRNWAGRPRVVVTQNGRSEEGRSRIEGRAVKVWSECRGHGNYKERVAKAAGKTQRRANGTG